MSLNRKMGINRIAIILLLVVGAVCVLTSAVYESSYIAILGVSFIFWGIILLYISPFKNIPLSFLTAATQTNLSNIERILSELEFNKKALYLPPKNLQDPESSLAFISKNPGQTLPQPEETKTTNLFNNNADGLFITPPGYSLSRIFEKMLDTSFTKVDVVYLQRNLPKLLVEELEIGEIVDISFEKNNFILEITNCIFSEDCQKTREFKQAHDAVGCFFSSSVACALAKATGKATTIEKEEQSDNGKITKITYQILGE